MSESFFSDKLFFQKISELESKPRYIEIIKKYLRKMISVKGVDTRYKRVNECIQELWKSSEKEPKLFLDYMQFEPILQRDREYRDHFIHSLNVYFMGYYIMNKLKEYDDVHNIGDYARSNPFGHRSGDCNLTWMLASTFHDIAYPIQEIDGWVNDILKTFIGINPRFNVGIGTVLPPIYVDLMDFLSRYHKNPDVAMLNSSRFHVDWPFYNILNEKVIEKNHGVWSGLILAHNLFIRGKYGSQEERIYGDFNYSHLASCHAMAMHDLHDIDVSYTKFPFSFLLILCDEIQDWGRPSKNARDDIIKLKDIIITFDDNPVINFSLDITKNGKDRLCERLPYLKTENKITIKVVDNNMKPFLII